MSKYYAPSISLHSFHCPYCGVYTQHHWSQVWVETSSNDTPIQWMDTSQQTLTRLVSSQHSLNAVFVAQDVLVGRCHRCDKYTVWIKDTMVHPDRGKAPPLNEDLSSDIRQDYEEAASICSRSPRGAAALLRLAMQKLCGELGLLGKTLNENIGELVKKGLDPKVQKAMDFVRITGNNAVHPGQIDLSDNREIAGKLFELVNYVAYEMITRSKMMDELYETLPEDYRDQVKQRDNK